MQRLPQEGWRYAFLLVVLFAISALATQATINYITPLVAISELRVVTGMVCALTFGLMFISGAFAVWAIRFSAEAESLRRLGRVVDNMTYIRDGVLAVDRQGRITGMNPTAREILEASGEPLHTLAEIHPALSEKDITLLLQGELPEEVECTYGQEGDERVFRFRSQPAKGANLILISDVTRLTHTRARHRRAAYLQLIAHISQGVANDFNSLLCGISGHAALITRYSTDASTVRQSADAVSRCASRGIHLAGRLLELSSSLETRRLGVSYPATNAEAAADALMADLPTAWKVVRSIDSSVAPVNLSGVQLEHIIHGLGLLAADTYDKESTLVLKLSPPEKSGLCHTTGDFVGFVILASSELESVGESVLHQRDAGAIGLIESVASSMLLQTGGRLDCFDTHEGIPVYRICLPAASIEELDEQPEELPLGLEAYISNWEVLISKDVRGASHLQAYLKECSVAVESTDGIVDTLARIERGANLSAIVLADVGLGEAYEGLLRAIVKLCPQAGIVVVTTHEVATSGISEDIVFIPACDSPTPIVRAMIEARSIARARRQPHSPEATRQS
jgi:PAS domain-containing protein